MKHQITVTRAHLDRALEETKHPNSRYTCRCLVAIAINDAKISMEPVDGLCSTSGWFRGASPHIDYFNLDETGFNLVATFDSYHKRLLNKEVRPEQVFEFPYEFTLETHYDG